MAKRNLNKKGGRPNPGPKPTPVKKAPAQSPKVQSKTESGFQEQRSLRWLIWGGALVTLGLWFALSDPFNSPKMWVLSVTGLWLLGWLAVQAKYYVKNPTLKITTIIAGAFALTLVVAWIATDNKFVGFFGQYARRTGLLEYLCLITFFLTAAFLMRLHRLATLDRTIVFLGSLLGIYGAFQNYKIDFVKWHYLYNPIFVTLGNPDFAGAILAILLVLNFGVAINSEKEKWFRAVAGFNTLLLTIIIVLSQARQGLLAAGIGIGLIVLVWIYQKNKRISFALSGFSIIGGLAVIAGMLKIGPLTRLFYKESVTYRGDYWRAAARMFIHHPLFGVGLDRYGAYFRQYRDTTQVLRRGPSIFADAAHSVPLQIAATGGIFVTLAFLALTGFTIWRGVVALRKTEGAAQIMAAVIFGAWITYQAQSFISIDNLGIAIWGYILGGAVIGISILPSDVDVRAPKPSSIQPLISTSLSIIMLVVSILFFKAESAVHFLDSVIPPKDPKLLSQYEFFVNKPLTFVFKDPHYQLVSALDYQKVGDNAKAISLLKVIVANDPYNTDALNALADSYENDKNWSAAVAVDRKAVTADPFNTTTLLKLGTDLKLSGDLAGAKLVIPLINSIAPNGADAKQAQSEFGK